VKPLLVLMSSSLPNETASATQQVMTAHALARAGLPVRLVAKRTLPGVSDKDVLESYGLTHEERLQITLIGVGPGRQKNRIFFGRLLMSSEWHSERMGVLTREPRVIPLNRMTRSRSPIVFEAHEPADVPDRQLNWRSRMLQRRALRSARGIVTVTKAGGERFIERGVASDRLAVIPNGAAPVDVGSLWEDRGVRVLLSALALMEDRITLKVVGESDPLRLAALSDFARSIGVDGRVIIHPAVPHAEVPALLGAADILVLPMTRSTVGQIYASPMKLFEYMAAGRPIVASDLPTVREIVGDREAWLFQPGDPAALAARVAETLRNWPEARRRAAAARDLLEGSFTWDARARSLISFMDRLGMLTDAPEPAIPEPPAGRSRDGSMRPLLILTSCNLPNETAIATQQVKTAHALARLGLPVRLVAKTDQPAGSAEDVLEHYGLAPVDGLRVRLIEVGPGRHRNRMFFLRSFLASEWRDDRLGLFTSEPRAIPLSRLTRAREPVLFEADEPANVPGRVLSWRSRVLHSRALRSARGIVTVTNAGAQRFIEDGADPERIAVIPNGADPVDTLPVRETLDGAIRLLYVGSHWPDRGVRVLATAIPLIEERATLDIVGESDPRRLAQLRDFVRSLGVEDRVNIRPAVPHSAVPALLASADIVVLPMMRSEVGEVFASPMKLFEYMAAGRPIVSADLPTVREIVSEETAWFFKPEDAAALAASVAEMIQRWPEARRRAAASRALLESSYTSEARARALLSFMDRLGMLDGFSETASSGRRHA
jgi:glycosyltransferase involved in cell wall biosynthesis